MYTIRAYYLQYCGSYAPHRRRRTMDDGRRTPDDGRWTLDAGPSTPYYKLTGELKNSLTKMPNCVKKLISYKITIKTGFVANDKWRQAPCFDMLHHIYETG